MANALQQATVSRQVQDVMSRHECSARDAFTIIAIETFMKYRHKPLSAQELREAIVSSDEHASIHAMVFSQQKGREVVSIIQAKYHRSEAAFATTENGAGITNLLEGFNRYVLGTLPPEDGVDPRLTAGAAKLRTLLIKKPILYVDYMTNAGAVPDKAREKLFEKLQNVREQAGDWDFGISCHCVAEIAQMIGSRARATTLENV